MEPMYTTETTHEYDPPVTSERAQCADYELLERLSAGGMAEVFLAKSRGADGFERLLAIKRMHPKMTHDLGLTKMFVDEANIAATLTHPNIGRVYELGVEGDIYFIAMEHIPGIDLAGIARAARRDAAPVPMAHACFIMARICDALGYAHDKRDVRNQSMRIVHRDVTPSNIILGFEGAVKLIDFGIAKAERRRARTANGLLKGKPRYLAPEQVRHEKPDHRADIFSAGVVLYELLTNTRLHTNGSDESILNRVRELEDLPVPSARVPGIPRELDEIVGRAIAPNVSERYESAHDFHDDLHAFMYDHDLRCTSRVLSKWLKDRFANQHTEHLARISRHSTAGPVAPMWTTPNTRVSTQFPPAPVPVAPTQTLQLPLPARPSKRTRVNRGRPANKHIIRRAASE
jgi:serine/threonine-protein kinase